MLPEGWKEVKLEEAVSFLDGKRKPLKSEDRLKIRGQYPYYGATGIIDYVNDYIFDDTLILMGEDGENIISRNLPHVFIISGKTWVNNHAHVLKAKKYCDTRFLSSYLESLNYEKYNTGSAQPKLNKAICENIRILLPPFPEQKKIAAILSTWDRAIEGTEKLLANSQQQKKALMQQLLTGKKRLPGFTGEWKNYKLYAVGNITTGNTPSTKDESLYGEKFLFITPVDLGNCKYVRKSERMLSEKGASISRMIPAGSIFFSCIGTIGKMGIATRDCITNQQINAIEVKKIHNNEFIYYQIFSNKEQIDKLTAKQAVPIINKKTFSNFIISSPSLPEQKAIAAVLSTTDEEIAAIESDLSRLRQEKKALMQQLLTGKRRVTVD